MGFLLLHVTPSLLPFKPGVPRWHVRSSALQPDNPPEGLSVLDGLQPLSAETLPGHRAQHRAHLWAPAWEGGALHGSGCGSCPLEGGAGITSGRPPKMGSQFPT